MHYNLMSELPEGFFDKLNHLIRVSLDTNLMCCHQVKEDADCDYSYNDNFANCDSMFRNQAPRRSLWAVGFLSLAGAIFVVVWRYFFPERNVVQTIMLVNLGVSDGLMGIYLIVIGIKDAQWSGEYYLHDVEWRTGWFCHLNGALSVFSSEVSVMLLSLIATDRFVNIVFPYTCGKLKRNQAHKLCGLIWLVGAVIAFLPLCGIKYFGVRYYGKNVVCLPLQLSPYLDQGWEYSTAIFIAINFAFFITIMVIYLAILCKTCLSSRRLAQHGTVREVQARARDANAKKETALAKRVFFIVLTDCACWMPIIIIGIRSHVEQYFDPPGDLAVWIAVFALPINSAINPLLYTLATPQVRTVLKAKLGKLWSNIRSIFHCCQDQQEQGGDQQLGQQGIEDNAQGEHIEMQELEHIEMQEIAQIEMQEMEDIGLPAPEQEQACAEQQYSSSSDDEGGEIVPVRKIVEDQNQDKDHESGECQPPQDEESSTHSQSTPGEDNLGFDTRL